VATDLGTLGGKTSDAFAINDKGWIVGSAWLSALLEGVDAPLDVAALRELEPPPQAYLTDDEIDAARLVMADMTDTRMPHTLGHSRAVANLAQGVRTADASARARHPLRLSRWLVHDIGEVALPVSVWGRPGPLTEAEWDQARLHPNLSERIVGRPCGDMTQVAAVAGRHHERLKGSGYFRGCRVADLAPTSRILAVAEAWRSWVDRPTRRRKSRALRQDRRRPHPA
jgi:HD-GYP domain-containing protein (c-di-GMP phosphodiesterase class II)